MRHTGEARSLTAGRRAGVAGDRPVLVPLEPGGRRYTIARGAAVAGLVSWLLVPAPAHARAKDLSDPPQEVPVSRSDKDDGRAGLEGRGAVAPVETVPERSAEASPERKAAHGERADPPATVLSVPEQPEDATATTAPTRHPAEVASVADPVVDALKSAGDVPPALLESSGPEQTGRPPGQSEVPARAATGAAQAGPAEAPPSPAAPAEPAAALPVPQQPAPERPVQPAPPMQVAASPEPLRTTPRPAPGQPVHRRAPSTAVVPAVAGGTYTVQLGDSLWAITARLLGAGSPNAAIAGAWPEVYAVNRDRIGADPNLILPGMELTIPEVL